jgi:cell division protein FtsQ
MWNNPRLMNATAGFLVALVAVAFLSAGLFALLRPATFPLREVTVSGALSNTAREDIERVLQQRVSGNFFSADLGAVRAALEQLPWVRRVQVRRAWPDRIAVRLEEHVALARWGDSGLVNTFGEYFGAVGGEGLPQFSGPQGSTGEVTQRYRRFSEIVVPLATQVDAVALSPRRSWQLRTSSGLQVELGREQPGEAPEARLARFVAAYPATLGRIARAHELVDLRYPNGFALRLPEIKG